MERGVARRFLRTGSGLTDDSTVLAEAFKQANGQPFLADSLARYGYLPNPANGNGLPVGFTETGAAGLQVVGMTCSACHTGRSMPKAKPIASTAVLRSLIFIRF
jgi:mono/diheme cytochrome c family protein